MKKTFQITHPKIKPSRMYEGVKSDIRKYLKRERGKELPEDVDFWDFDCKFGPSGPEATVVHQAELPKCIDAAEREQLTSFYIEILAKPGYRKKKDEGAKEPAADSPWGALSKDS